VTRLTNYLLPTEKEAPADAEALSHKLMVRAGLIRQVGTGLWTFMPAGWRVHEKVVQIVREEMNAAGAHEMLMPVLTPAELWKRSGRYSIDEVFKLHDRKGAELVLAMTHEETLTTHIASIVRSYRDLPLLLYHFQIKERDEPRPRAGLLRTREFIMKDAYSFDRDRAGLDESYERYARAYDRVFERTGLEWYSVESDVGAMGGFGAHEYMAPCAAGENDVALAPGYAANVEVASAEPQPVAGMPPELEAPESVTTPGQTTVAAVSEALGAPAGALLKAYPVIVEGRGLVVVVVRGDHKVNEIKLATTLGAPFRPAREAEFADALGPAGLHRAGRRAGAHPARRRRARRSRRVRLRRQPAGHPPARRPARPRLPVRARGRAVRGGRGHRREPSDPDRAGDRGRQHLQARHALLRAARGDVPRRCGACAAHLDGLLRDRPGADRGRRGGAYADEKGISWPRAVAPFDVELVGLGKAGTEERALADRLYDELREAGLDVLYDDRDLGPGGKFRRRGAPGLPAAADGRPAHPGGGPGRGADPPRP
jgi:prolyl-tRNA synthetase